MLCNILRGILIILTLQIKMKEYLLSEYKRTGWHTFLVRDLVRKEIFNKEEANILASGNDPLIHKSDGVHGYLIVLNTDHKECIKARL